MLYILYIDEFSRCSDKKLPDVTIILKLVIRIKHNFKVYMEGCWNSKKFRGLSSPIVTCILHLLKWFLLQYVLLTIIITNEEKLCNKHQTKIDIIIVFSNFRSRENKNVCN